MENENKYILERIKKNDKIVVGVSGGSDSVFLLLYLIKLKQRPKLIIAHINHKTRKNENEKDERFVKELAKKLNIPCFVAKKDFSKTKGNFEEAARKYRYDFFEKIRKKVSADWIATGHHKNDQIETLLQNMIRGASLEGFKGIAAIDEERKVLRPLIDFSKKDILRELKNIKQNFREDKSNKNNAFSRNRIRNIIIPEIEKINPSFMNTFLSSMENLAQNIKTIELIRDKWIEKNVKNENGKLVFNLKSFLSIDECVKKNVITKLFKEINQKNLLKKQILEIQKLLKNEKSDKYKEFGIFHIIRIAKSPIKGEKKVIIESFQKKK